MAMSEHIKTRETQKKPGQPDDEDFDMYFPVFVIALRDFTLDLEIDGKEVSANEYMEHCLRIKKGNDDRTRNANAPRLCIRKYFRERHCFTFDRPVGRKKLRHLDDLPDEDLSSDFVEEMTKFIAFIFKKAPVKKLENGHEINGRMLASLASAYVETISNGGIPCIENAVESMAALENRRAVDEALELYKNTLNESVSLPAPDDETVLVAHRQTLKQAIAYFLKKAVFDSDERYQKELNDKIEEELKTKMKENETASEKACWGVLKQLSATIDSKMKEGAYARPGGFKDYQADLKSLKGDYAERLNLGVKKNAVFFDFMEEAAAKGEAILAADQKVTEEEKKAEEATLKALLTQKKMEAVEREAKLERHHQEEMMKAMLENQKQAEEKATRHHEEQMRHQEKILEMRLNEQKMLAQERAHREADAMKDQIHQQELQIQELRIRQQQQSRGSCITQ